MRDRASPLDEPALVRAMSTNVDMVNRQERGSFAAEFRLVQRTRPTPVNFPASFPAARSRRAAERPGQSCPLLPSGVASAASQAPERQVVSMCRTE